jgi:hypothetical protein
MSGSERRTAIIGGGVLLALFAIWLYLVKRDSDPSPAAASAAPTATAPIERGTAPAMAPAPAAPTAPAPPEDQITPSVPENAPPIDLPPETQRLTAEFVPGTTEWEEVPLLEGGAQTIRFLPASYNVIAPAPIVLYLELVDAKQKRIALANPHARVRSFDAADAWIDVPMTDAGDHRYTGTLVPTPEQQKTLLGRVVAEGIVTTPEAGTRRIPQALIYTRGPRAHLTGRWRDAKRDGHLMLDAEIVVDEAGMFTLMAQVVGPAREPIALVRDLEQLATGTHWMHLRVWGKALRDAGVAGPYEVRNVLLTRDMNERGDYDPGPTILSAYKTAAYPATDFSAEPYVAPPEQRGEEIGPDHPSQRGNPRPLHQDSERPSRQW